MSDPRRLIDTESGRARALLDGGQSERAPAHVRARVSSSVSAIVAGLDLGAASPSLSGSEPGFGHEGTSQTGLSTGAPNGVLTKLLDAASSTTAIKLSAVFAALGLGGVVYRQVQLRNATPIVATSVVQPQTAPSLPPTAHTPDGASASKNEGGSPEERAVMRDGPARPVEREDAGSPRSAAEAAASRLGSRSPARKPRSAPRLPEDDLAPQLTLIARARARLRAGEPHLALELLDEYARRFPRGSLEPEARALEQRARALASDE